MQLTRSRRRLGLLAAVLALALLGGRPPAEAAEDRAARAARAHFQKAEKAFSMGKFDEALKGYEDAYEQKALPGLLFNIAQCHRNMSNPERAIFFYERYLALDPGTPNRAMVEELIAEERKRLEQRSAPPPTPPAPNPVPPPAPPPSEPPPVIITTPDRDRGAAAEAPLYKKWWVWTAAAVVVAGATAALVIKREGAPPRGQLGAVDYR